MTPEELREEYLIEFETRLGMMVGAKEPTPQHRAIARQHALAHVEQLKKHHENLPTLGKQPD